ncbi:MAG TPA: phosphoadenosine phosphosulfate reductase family protein [Chloroflexia bacterium]|jgi:3'-phosphoadenosine 5'-phosphosulfate sulfotransferase (PAPS reductase)/FAD synthetase
MPRAISQQGNLKLGWRRLKLYQSLSLDSKIRYAQRMIEQVLARHKAPVVCWSGGKDSTVLLHLVKQYVPDIPVVFNDTGVEFPETRVFVQSLTQAWNINLHVARPKHGEGFWEVSERYGWPILGKEQSANIERGRRKVATELGGSNNSHETRSNGFISLDQLQDIEGLDKLSDMERVLVSYDVDVSTRCCNFLKERPTKELELSLGVDCKILGIMASESRRRALLWIDHTDYFYNKRYYTSTQGIWKASPISIWLESDIWAYHERYNIPHCEIYDKGHDRNGCWTCAMGVKFGQLERLRKSHPQLFDYLIVRRGMGRELLKAKLALRAGNRDPEELEEYAETVDMKQFLAQRPCFFDSL